VVITIYNLMLPILRILLPIWELFGLWKANERAPGDTKPVFFTLYV
jgi:hypothetical protein